MEGFAVTDPIDAGWQAVGMAGDDARSPPQGAGVDCIIL